METTTILLKNLIEKSTSRNNIFKRNILKEYLQILVLDFIYSHKNYNRLIFYGGSCLAHCYNLPRLSEDLDFVDLKKEIDLKKLAKDLKAYFEKKTDLDIKISEQKFRLYLKFPLLHELKLAQGSESDLLFLKIEIFRGFDYCQNYKTEIIPLFKFNKTILIKTFDLPTLMSTKINAVLYRKWEKTDKTGKTIVKVKGRDYFDLMWYLQKGVIPNLSCIVGVKNNKVLKRKLLGIIEKVDAKSIYIDLEPLIDNLGLIKKISKDIKNILKSQIEKIK